MSSTKQFVNNQTNTHTMRINYREKIQLISAFFNISKPAAIYLYHRRRQSFPFKKKTMEYLNWNLSIQNGLVKIMGENPDIDWGSCDFTDEEVLFIKYDIDVGIKTYSVYKNKPKKIFDDDCVDVDEKKSYEHDGWTVVVANTKNAGNKFLLRKMGLFPQSKENVKKNRRKRTVLRGDDPESIPTKPTPTK